MDNVEGTLSGFQLIGGTDGGEGREGRAKERRRNGGMGGEDVSGQK